MNRVQREARVYTSRPCYDGYTSLHWSVTGGTADGRSGGVLAWCYDALDANEALAALAATGEYRNLAVENLGPA